MQKKIFVCYPKISALFKVVACVEWIRMQMNEKFSLKIVFVSWP